MARERLTSTTDDLISSGGSVLWSIVHGEALEFPIILNFLTAVEGYTYECTVVEANNTAEQTQQPTTVKSGGQEFTIQVRVPSYKGSWNPSTAYDQNDVIIFDDIYYYLLSGTDRVDSTDPDLDPLWTETYLNMVYLQIPTTLIDSFEVAPTVGHPVYAFIELRVSEPAGVAYQRTWKPVRGLIEVLYSPTEETP